MTIMWTGDIDLRHSAILALDQAMKTAILFVNELGCYIDAAG